MNKILICDDEKEIVRALRVYLMGAGYEVVEAYNGKEAIAALEQDSDIKLVLMDVMMPVMDGISATVEIRNKSNIPIILLTAKSESHDKILGLNIGADDYITKPFNPSEVIARVNSQIRRFDVLGSKSENLPSSVLVNGGIMLDDTSKSVSVDGEDISLTPTEFDILKLFLNNKGKVISPKEIYKQVWNGDPLGAENTVLVHIRHLRKKIEINPAEPRYIVSVFGHGYKMDERN
ncbi:MAG: response regulator transcription factor [Clostridia bacterium]|nr:response regulator transcription factor [Clostridia bacterium]